MPGLYRKKVDTTIEAIQWDGTRESAREIIDWAFSYGTDVEYVVGNGVQNEPYLVIYTLEGKMRAITGCWIARGSENEFWPIKQSVFDNTYEEA